LRGLGQLELEEIILDMNLKRKYVIEKKIMEEKESRKIDKEYSRL
jgi:hypothetical protein